MTIAQACKIFTGICLFNLSTFFNVSAQSQLLENVPHAFERIPVSKPSSLYFYNPKNQAPAGGHLQGVQVYSAEGKERLVLTGSSGSYSYYLTGAVDSAIKLFKISDSPLRHAGGCQVVADKLFVGVEDNVAKDTAVELAVTLSGNSVTTVATRSGSYKRPTAGATGAVLINGQYLVAVGDWDTKHIDFYQSIPGGFRYVSTFATPDTGTWGSYQNINLLADTGGHIFMIGFCKTGNTNRADLFSVDSNYNLKLVSIRYFTCTKGCSFRYGTGIGIKNKNTLAVYCCQRVLKRKNTVNVFGE